MPFHFQLNAVYVLFRTHFGTAAQENPSSLEQHRNLLCHAKLDVKKPEYNKGKELVMHSLIARVLDCTRILLKKDGVDDLKNWLPDWEEFNALVATFRSYINDCAQNTDANMSNNDEWADPDSAEGLIHAQDFDMAGLQVGHKAHLTHAPYQMPHQYLGGAMPSHTPQDDNTSMYRSHLTSPMPNPTTCKPTVPAVLLYTAAVGPSSTSPAHATPPRLPPETLANGHPGSLLKSRVEAEAAFPALEVKAEADAFPALEVDTEADTFWAVDNFCGCFPTCFLALALAALAVKAGSVLGI
ncbi:hypothetical protein C8R43DRAFT_1120836 [Mycena crocata]|nr:hypothetical protein C8R43DRAFT_1120836 [Mycena crocata]